jgi:hypothetical protein
VTFLRTEWNSTSALAQMVGTDGNMSVIELWDSKNEWATYAAETLGPVLTNIGIEIERGEPEALEVHNVVRR